MEAEERPLKMRKMSHDVAQPAQPKAQLIVEPLRDLTKAKERSASSKGEQINNQSDADTAGSADDGTPAKAEKVPRPPGMSKNAWKKLQKKADWEAGREYRKVIRKEKILARKARDRAAKLNLRAQEIGQPIANGNANTSRARRHIKLPVTFLIDCSFDDLMMEREMISLGSQLTRSYSDNNRAPFQAHMIVSSWGGLLKERFDTVLAKHHENWRGVVFTDQDIVQAAEMASKAMKGKYGGELAGAFSRHRLVDQSNIDSPKDVMPPDHTNRGNDITSQPIQKIPHHSYNLETGDADPSNKAHSFQVAESRYYEQIEQDNKSPPSSASAPQATASLERHENLQGDIHRSLATNISAPANGQNSISSPHRDLSQSSMLDAEQGEIIYLTSDSPHTLDELKPYSTYIIGGLVDKNRHKGICYKTACEKGIKTAKLPIGEFMEMQSRFVLATNHVMEIMVHWLECGDWGQAFLNVIPKRKGGKLRESAVMDYAEQDIESRASADIGDDAVPD